MESNGILVAFAGRINLDSGDNHYGHFLRILIKILTGFVMESNGILVAFARETKLYSVRDKK